MKFKFAECRKVLHRALVEALAENSGRIRELQKTEEIWAISYDILPWDPYVGIAFRVKSESGHDSSLNSSGWNHSHFIEDISCKHLKPARDYTHTAYGSASGGLSSQEIAHLIFLAAADALLDESIASLLQSFGVNAPVIEDSLAGGYFKFVVLDDDGTIKANYCDIIRSNRVTRRLLGKAM